MYIITIDTGTSNTRVKLWNGGKVAAASFVGTGVRDTAISGSKTKLQQGVRDAISMVLEQKNLKASNVDLFLASGMITSNVGLFEVPHVCAPAGVKELAEHMVSARIDEVVEKPIWFVPGVKNTLKNIDLGNCEEMDMMRGEEAETFGILEGLKLEASAVVILPGSHTKFVSLNRDKRITGCITTLAGELLSVLTNNTILASALDNSFAEKADEELILAGARYSREVGLNRTCFTVRILEQFTGYPADARANFLLGAVLENDIFSLKNSRALNFDSGQAVIIGGSKILKRAFEILVKNDGCFTGAIHVVEDEAMKDMAGLGSIAIAKARGLLRREQQ
ncbi:MAG TPA: 2-dehydro-3-deoxygalactonokinase [Clostridia bacterium]|nr:2-dehydro-3-deoxygalactonokinase [Clostridia bacterium]